MKGAEHERLCLAREVVWSVDAGIAVTLLVAVLRGANVAPRVMDFLLRPGFYLLPGDYGRVFRSAVPAVVADLAIYGSLAFAMMRLWPHHERVAKTEARWVERRRAFRVAAAAPVFVYGWTADEPFGENAKTLNVSEAGGLITLSATVRTPQKLVLTNPHNEWIVPCRVTHSSTTSEGQTVAGLEFLESAPGFWEIEFVPGGVAKPTDGVPAESR